MAKKVLERENIPEILALKEEIQKHLTNPDIADCQRKGLQILESEVSARLSELEARRLGLKELVEWRKQ